MTESRSGRVIRLRPVVHATPTESGVHVRGWVSSFTLGGGAGLWTVWERLAAKLAEGVPVADFGVPEGISPSVGKAIEVVLTQLREHDMVVEVPAGWGADGPGLPPPDTALWLESVADDPAEAWRRLSAALIGVRGGGTLAAAARRALSAAGIQAAGPVPGDGLVLFAGGRSVAVVAGCGAEVGYVLPAGLYAERVAAAPEVRTRLGVDRMRLVGDSVPAVPEVLAALVGSAAAHRLLCAVAGLPDPAVDADVLSTVDGQRHVGERPAVLVARLDPLRAEYHPWLTGAPRPLPSGFAGAARLAELLSDPELGVVPPAELGALPQLPANLATVGATLGVGTTTDAARVDAVLRAVGSADVAFGVDPVHARGVALRHAVRDRSLTGDPVSGDDWLRDPTARRWWKALTLRFGVPASLRVRGLAAGVVQAEVLSPQGVLAWAIEGTAADAVAFAALAATGVVQAQEARLPVSTGSVWLCGAAPAWRPDDTAPWTTRDWYWPATVAEAEPRVQAALATLLDVPLPDVEPPADASLAAAGLLACRVPIPAELRGPGRGGAG
ncbi:hypothetical protein [Actinokineospora sp.]|uniref:hypothetical protein n=1 Tax=Actinokineospora sp. TaxID=1872133 RepID=UPI00403784BC